MRIHQIMTKRLVTVEMDDKLSLIKEIFEKLKFHHLLVVDSNKLYGIISDRDLLKAISPNLGTSTESFKDTATLNKRVHQIMTRNPIVLHADADVFDAIDLFNQHRISCLPVVDDDFKPIGVISWRDILRELGTKRDLFSANSDPKSE